MADDRQAPTTKVAVVGGGIAGLTAAWALANRGYEVTLYEERMHLGGKLGAHPARIPLERGKGDWERKEKEAVEAFINLEWGAFSSQETEDAFCTAMDCGKVPKFVLDALRFHYRRVVKRLGLSITALQDWSFETEVRRLIESAPVGEGHVKPLNAQNDLIGARRKWEVRYEHVQIGDLKPMTLAFRVAIYDRRDGRVALELSDTVYHEHCYHMFLNWYRNFWALMEEIGLERSTVFRPHDQVVHVLPGSERLARRSQTMRTIGDFSHGAENLLSGAAHAPDLFLWMYSMVDLVSHQFDPGRYLDRRSVHGFLSSRWYATDDSVRFHEHLLAKAFAVPTYFSSAYTYRKYVEYTMAAPDPMLWVLHGDSYTKLFEPFERYLEGNPVEGKRLKIKRGLQVRGIFREGTMRLEVRPSDILGAPRSHAGRRVGDDGETPADAAGDISLTSFVPEYIVVAVPPSALARITGDIRTAVPGLASVRKLQSAVTASLDLYFLRRIGDIPPCHMVLRQSALGLTLVDNAQAWHDDDDPDRPTQLSVAVTDFYKIDGMSKAEASAAIIEDLRRFIDFRDEDIDFTRTYLQMNDREPLFINEVGSEPWRPGTRTEIPYLFLAGDFCENDIGVVSVEGAVVSGLLAARAVQAQLRVDDPEIRATDPRLEEIPILQPETHPLVSAEAVKALLLPQAAMAYAASKKMEWARFPERALTPRDLQFHLEQALQSASAAPAIGGGLAAQALQWVADLHARGRT